MGFKDSNKVLIAGISGSDYTRLNMFFSAEYLIYYVTILNSNIYLLQIILHDLHDVKKDRFCIEKEKNLGYKRPQIMYLGEENL